MLTRSDRYCRLPRSIKVFPHGLYQHKRDDPATGTPWIKCVNIIECRYGGTGRRARLRIWWDNSCPSSNLGTCTTVFLMAANKPKRTAKQGMPDGWKYYRIKALKTSGLWASLNAFWICDSCRWSLRRRSVPAIFQQITAPTLIWNSIPGIYCTNPGNSEAILKSAWRGTGNALYFRTASNWSKISCSIYCIGVEMTNITNCVVVTWKV